MFGPPGSGKGTQAKLLRNCFDAPHISTGDMLREHIEAGDAVGREVREVMQAGKLVPDELVNRLLEERIDRPDCEHGFILDGYPRTVPQAEEMSKLLKARNVLPVVIHLQVNYNKVIARLSGRRICPVCGALYSSSSKPPSQDGFCDKDGTKLVTREDDSEPVIRRRLDEYCHLTKPVLEYFERSGVPGYEIDGGEGSPREIAARICEFITKR